MKIGDLIQAAWLIGLIEKLTGLIAVVFLVIFCPSCALQSTRNIPGLPFESFVKIDAKYVKVDCPNRLTDPSCLVDSGVGSGAIISVGGALQILTAGHVCHVIEEMTENAKDSSGSTLVDVMIHSDNGAAYAAFVLSIHPLGDICLMGTNEVLHTHSAVIAHSNPLRAEVVWGLMAPAGVSGPGLVPVISGHFSGGDNMLSVFTVPSHPGGSGGPIVNSDGRIVGIVSQIHKDFHHIVLSPSLYLIKEFVLTSSKDAVK